MKKIINRIPLGVWAVLWGGVIGLSMMRVPSSVYFTPVYLLALLAFTLRPVRQAVLELLHEIPMVGLYVGFSAVSLVWAATPAVSLQEIRGDLIIPCLALLGSFAMARLLSHEGATKFLLAGLWVTFLAGSLWAYLNFGEHWIELFFDSVGYYSTYLFLLSGLSLPFMTLRWRAVFYPLLVLLLFLTSQRVAWVLFPAICCADLLLVMQKQHFRAWMALPMVVVLGFSYFMLKQLVDSKPTNVFRPEVEAHGTFERLVKNERLAAWQAWLLQAEKRPLIGHGFGRHNVKADVSADGQWPERNLEHGHNVLLNNFLQLGLVGVVLYLAAQFQLLRFLIRFRSDLAKAAALVIIFFFLRNLFDDFSLKRLLVVYGLILGWCLGNLVSSRSPS